jgi:competence protein ComEA
VRLLVFIALAVLGVLVLFRPAIRPPTQTGWAVPTAAPAIVASAAPDLAAAAEPVRGHRRVRRHGRRVVAAAAPSGGVGALAYVAGSVVRPGVYPVPVGARVRDLLVAAGGTRGDADLVAVNLAAHVEDGDEVVVPAQGEDPPRRSRRPHGPRRHVRGHRRSAERARVEPPAAPIDLNRADADELATIPGIGPTLAERIVVFRAANGPFTSPDELLDVEGFTDKRLDTVAQYVVTR